MLIAILNILVGLVLAAGGAQEAIVRGILGGERPSFVAGLVGTVVSLLLAVSGVAVWLGWRGARGLVVAACLLVALFCVVAALPPHYVGVPALLLGVGYPAAALLSYGRGARQPGPSASRSRRPAG